MPAPISLPDSFDADGLRLRPLRVGDVGSVVEICRTGDVQRFTRVPSPYTEEDAREFVELSGRGLDEGTGLHLAVTEPGQDECLGAVGLDLDWRDATGELGYWLAPEVRGRGLMTRAVRRLSRFALGQLGLARLELRAATINLPSNLVALRCGFRPEGRLRRATLLGPTGDRSAPRGDMFVYRLLPDDLDAPPAVAVSDDLATDGVRLRPLAADDVAPLVRADGDPSPHRWDAAGSGLDDVRARELVVRSRQGLVTGDDVELAVADADSGELLGVVGVTTAGLQRGVGELGWWTAPAARERDPAPAAVGLLAAWATDVLGLERLFAAVPADRERPNEVAAVAGLAHETTLGDRVRDDGRLRDANVWVW